MQKVFNVKTFKICRNVIFKARGCKMETIVRFRMIVVLVSISQNKRESVRGKLLCHRKNFEGFNIRDITF